MANTVVTLPTFAPDQSANSGVLIAANNVYPKVDGYGPLSGFTAFSSQLGAAFKGGGSFIATDGSSYLFVGTATGLVRYSGGSWTNIVTSMTVSEQWRFAQFGNYAIGVNGSVTKVVDLSSGVGSTLTGAPAGTSIGIVGDYVIICQDTSDKVGVFTSGFNDHTDWDVVSSTATYQPMLAGGEVMGFAGGEYGVILQRQRIVRMSLTGDTTAPFQYDVVSSEVGCAAKGSVAQYGDRVFFLSDSGFKCLVAGQGNPLPIGSEKVDRTFASRVARDNWQNIYSAIDPQSKVVIWCAPGTPGLLFIYNWELDKWTTAELSIDGIFSGYTTSTDIDTLHATYPDIDAITISLDDPRWSGGNPRLFCVQSAYVGTFFGSALKATFELSFAEPVTGRVSRIRAIRPITDCTTGNTIRLDARARLGDAENATTVTDMRDSGIMPIRCSGRYVKAKWDIAAGSSWSYAQGLEFEVEAGGAR